jgi:DNA polymerase-4
VLRDYGIHSVGPPAAVPPVTVQRLLGGRAGTWLPTAPWHQPPTRRSPGLLALAAVRCSLPLRTSK